MIECLTTNCVAPHVSYYNRAMSIAAWNRRVSDTTVPEPERESLRSVAEERDALRAALHEIRARCGDGGAEDAAEFAYRLEKERT